MSLRKSAARVAVSAAVVSSGALAVAGAGAAAPAGASPHATATHRWHPPQPSSGCRLKGGVKHVVEILFDNVHFNRDNPNVPSDIEMIPSLEHFIEQNGTLLSDNHTPLIAHTANDSLTTYTGLYGDRAGMPISNSYQAYNADGTTDPAVSFAYWTDPIFDTAKRPNPGHDTNPSMVYSPVPPATSPTPIAPTQETPAPWVPFTRAGCDVGNVATANMVLENPTVDIPEVFGPNSPEAQQLAADPDSFKDAETADYVGLAVHCAQGHAGALCADARAVKYGQTTPSPTAVSDLLPDEPGGYHGYQALFGARYIGPQLGAGTPNLTRNGYEITDAQGNLVDETGKEMDGAFLTGHPGFPGFSSINAAQTLAYMADMEESGIPVTYGYIADLHGNEFIPSLSAPGGPCYKAPAALGSGSACYVAQAQFYNQSFSTFFARLAADGITPRNTLFVFSADEGDHETGANVGRAIQPTPANCDGATVSGDTVSPDVACTYPSGSFGELDGNLTGLLATQTSDTTPFSMEADTAPEIYVTGDPAADSAAVRKLEHDVAALTFQNPYAGGPPQTIANYLADPTEEAILHMVNADPARTPTFAMFAKPDYYLYDGGASCTGPCVVQNTGFAWDHGDYAAEIDNNWVGLVGPGVAPLGLDGSTPEQGPSSAGPDSGQVTPVQLNNPGTWVDETDIQPTLLYLAGLSDDYTPDGRVISQILARRDRALDSPSTTALATCYKQLDSSVGEFGAATLIADSNAVEGTSNGDATYQTVVLALRALDSSRDFLADFVKRQLTEAAFEGKAIRPFVAAIETGYCNFLIDAATLLASSTTASTARRISAQVADRFGRDAARMPADLARLAAPAGARTTN
jgi:hypothetical protein